MDVDGKSGWYFVLPEDSEKVLATSVTSQGNVMFTTLVPDANAEVAVEDLCESPQTQGRYYSMNVLTGTAGSDLNGDGTITDSDLMLVISENAESVLREDIGRYFELKEPSIGPPELYLGGHVHKLDLDNGAKA